MTLAPVTRNSPWQGTFSRADGPFARAVSANATWTVVAPEQREAKKFSTYTKNALDRCVSFLQNGGNMES
jgi:hypothetical protein